MPTVTGLDIARFCEQNSPKTKIILFSAYRDFEYARMAIQLRNIIDYVQKPIDYEEFFDRLKELNIRPLVELSSMPLELASGDTTTFVWKMNVTTPKDYNEWYDLCKAFTSHMVDRYGLDEVKKWYFEVG